MLQHVLKEMYIDPKLLEELEDFEKETLFCCMRGEQIRRWKEWDQKETEAVKNQVPRIKRIGGKSVKWLCDDSGDLIVDIIDGLSGEDTTDFNEKDSKSNNKELTIKDGSCIDLSTHETADKSSKYVNVVSSNKKSLPSVILNFTDKRDALKELSLNKKPKVARQVAEWEKRVSRDESRASDKESINNNDISQASNRKSIEPATADEIQQEQLWREQQKVAKETELRIRSIARIAREDYRRSLIENQNKIDDQNFNISKNSSIDDIRKNILKPPGNETIFNWYRTKELPKGAGLQNNNKAEDWFHGLLSQKEAEVLLRDEKDGTFLVRISERLWNYTISYKTSHGIEHYLIDASNDHYYQLLVNQQINHSSLNELISYHKTNSLVVNGNEFLLYPCPTNKSLSLLFADYEMG